VTAQNNSSGAFATYAAHAVIVTVQLGVLQGGGAFSFAPPQPPPLASAISRLGVGALKETLWRA
jgi:hypothetical protein